MAGVLARQARVCVCSGRGVPVLERMVTRCLGGRWAMCLMAPEGLSQARDSGSFSPFTKRTPTSSLDDVMLAREGGRACC